MFALLHILIAPSKSLIYNSYSTRKSTEVSLSPENTPYSIKVFNKVFLAVTRG